MQRIGEGAEPAIEKNRFIRGQQLIHRWKSRKRLGLYQRGVETKASAVFHIMEGGHGTFKGHGREHDPVYMACSLPGFDGLFGSLGPIAQVIARDEPTQAMSDNGN